MSCYIYKFSLPLLQWVRLSSINRRPSLFPWRLTAKMVACILVTIVHNIHYFIMNLSYYFYVLFEYSLHTDRITSLTSYVMWHCNLNNWLQLNFLICKTCVFLYVCVCVHGYSQIPEQDVGFSVAGISSDLRVRCRYQSSSGAAWFLLTESPL